MSGVPVMPIVPIRPLAIVWLVVPVMFVVPIVSGAIVLVVVLDKCVVPIVPFAIVMAISIHATMELKKYTHESRGAIAKSADIKPQRENRALCIFFA